MSVLRGDCVEVMAGMEPDSVDALVTDPPYGLEFMGKEWDRLGDIGKTSHSGPAERDATTPFGRTRVAYSGSSNRKCLICSKWQWDHPGRKCECERPEWPNVAAHQGRLMSDWHAQWATAALRVAKPGAYLLAFGGTRTVHRMTCALEDAGWVVRDMLVWAYAQGFPKSRASLKPAWEPIVLARKPGASRDLNIEAARIPATDNVTFTERVRQDDERRKEYRKGTVRGQVPTDLGRWPANVILTDPILDGGWEGVVGGGETGLSKGVETTNSDSWYGKGTKRDRDIGYGDTGTYSRFFLIPDGRGSALSGTMDACRCTPADSATPPTSTRETVPPTAPGHASPPPSEQSDLPACDAASPSLWGETSTAPSPAPTLPDGTLASTAIEDPALPTESSTRPPASGTLPAPPPGTTSLSGQSASPAGAPQTSTDITTTTAAPSTCGRCAGRVTTGSTPQPPRPSSGAQLPVEQPDHGRFYLVAKAPTRERVLSDGRRSPHPTQKPEALIRHLVTLVTPPGGLVLDPFLGSGTLGVVADGLGVRWLGIEREAEYADWAEERVRDGKPEWAA